jgi:hypothetical protein
MGLMMFVCVYFQGKMVVVLAGYTREMHQMLRANPGLASRFPDEFAFPAFTRDDSLQLLHNVLVEQRYTVSANVMQELHVRNLMAQLVGMSTFANGRDVHSLASRIEMLLAEAETGEEDATMSDGLVVTADLVTRALLATLADMRERDDLPDPDAVQAAAANKRRLGKTRASPPPPSKRIKQTTDEAASSNSTSPQPAYAYDTEMAAEVTRIIDKTTEVQCDSASDEEANEDNDDDQEPWEEVKAKLAAMGACRGGYGWKRVDKGWVCEASVCRVTDEQYRTGKQ